MRIRLNRWAVVLCATLAWSVAAADDASPLDGSWKISGRTANNAPINGKLELKGMQGTWFTQIRAASARDTCLGREYPLEVQSVDEASLVFIVRRDASLKGCADMTIKLRRTGPALLENGREDAAHLKIQR